MVKITSWKKQLICLYISIYLNTVVAGGYASILNFYISWWMRKFTFGIWTRAFIPLKFTAHFQLQPARIFSIQQAIHVDHRCHFRVAAGEVVLLSHTHTHSRRRRRWNSMSFLFCFVVHWDGFVWFGFLICHGNYLCTRFIIIILFVIKRATHTRFVLNIQHWTVFLLLLQILNNKMFNLRKYKFVLGECVNFFFYNSRIVDFNCFMIKIFKIFEQ